MCLYKINKYIQITGLKKKRNKLWKRVLNESKKETE
jgi:hypothetical protein